MQRTTADLRELAKSLASLSGAASFFGVGQFARLLRIRSPRASADDIQRRLDSVSRVVTGQLGDPMASAFARADVFQRGLVDLIANILTLNASGVLASGAPVITPIASAADPLVAALDRAVPGSEVRWLELRNKIEIYFLVENAAARLRISPVERVPLPELVERAYALGPFPALWAVEGLGHVFGQQALQVTPSPRGLLTGPESEASRPAAMLMLHAGIGLAFAEWLLANATPENAASTLPPAVRAFGSLCRENSRPGYVGAAYESLGLFTQTFHTPLVAAVDRELQAAAPELLGFFWHGVGRAIYFAPRNFLPSAEIDWSTAPSAAPHPTGRLNITAGLAWATTLVNMRQPSIMDGLIPRHGAVLSADSAFANGVESSIIMRADTTPDADFIDAFCSYRPAPPAGSDPRDWDRLVAGPCRDGLVRDRPLLRRTGQLDSIFRYRPSIGRDG